MVDRIARAPADGGGSLGTVFGGAQAGVGGARQSLNGITVERLTGAPLKARLGDLAQLRIAVFRTFPYLYEGTPEYEARYLKTYAASPDSAIVAAFDGDRLVGAATGLPLEHEPAYVRDPVEKYGLDVGRVFYFGESVLLPVYRGRGIGVAFFEQREAHARALGRFRTILFCAVDRPAGHPRRPEGYQPLDDFWRRRGYHPVPGLACAFSWRDLDESEESPKRMLFWRKDIA